MVLHTPGYKPNGSETASFITSKGLMVVKLDGIHAPINVGNFVELATSGFYDGLKFHRYVPDFVIQSGCPNTRDFTPEEVRANAGNPFMRVGTGGPGYVVQQEFYGNKHNQHVFGSLAMARTQEPDSAGSQFYFSLGKLPQLDSKYTVIGVAIMGFDVISSLRVGDIIQSVTIRNTNEQVSVKH